MLDTDEYDFFGHIHKVRLQYDNSCQIRLCHMLDHHILRSGDKLEIWAGNEWIEVTWGEMAHEHPYFLEYPEVIVLGYVARMKQEWAFHPSMCSCDDPDCL